MLQLVSLILAQTSSSRKFGNLFCFDAPFFLALTISIRKLQGSGTSALHALRLQRNVVLQQGVFLQQVLHLQQVFPKVGRQEPSLEMQKKKTRS